MELSEVSDLEMRKAKDEEGLKWGRSKIGRRLS